MAAASNTMPIKPTASDTIANHLMKSISQKNKNSIPRITNRAIKHNTRTIPKLLIAPLTVTGSISISLAILSPRDALLSNKLIMSRYEPKWFVGKINKYVSIHNFMRVQGSLSRGLNEYVFDLYLTFLLYLLIIILFLFVIRMGIKWYRKMS